VLTSHSSQKLHRRAQLIFYCAIVRQISIDDFTIIIIKLKWVEKMEKQKAAQRTAFYGFF
jgi:hypothetical protein